MPKDARNPVTNEIRTVATFDRRFHYRKEGYQCVRCRTGDRDCFFPKQLAGRRPICTNCKRMRKGCHGSYNQRVSISPELGAEYSDESRASHLKSIQQTKGKSSVNLQQGSNTTVSAHSGTNLGKRKVRLREPTMVDYVSSSSRHSSDSDSEHAITPPPVSTSSSRIDFRNLPPNTVPGRIVVRHIPIPSAFKLSSPSTLSTPARTKPHEIRPKVRAPPNKPPPSSNQSSSSSTSSAVTPTNHETQPQATGVVHTTLRQMEHVNATMIGLCEALEGEIREAEEADRIRRARIYRIESAMKLVNRDIRAADNAFNSNMPISMGDRTRLGPELDRYRQTLAKLKEHRLNRDRAAQERRHREQEHRDLLNDELLGKLGKR